MIQTLIDDLKAVRANDPAATSWLETLICHTPLHAVFAYRIAHFLHSELHLSLVPRFISALARFWTGVEIHPGARIGKPFFIDHGTGVVIGETAEIGNDCVIFHNVTLGGTGKHRGKRHPTIGDQVLIGTGSTLLGPITVGSHTKIGANTVILMHDVPPGCTAVGTPARLVVREGRRVNEGLARTELSEQSIPVSEG
jgi:serine O-acetyltransferase